MEDVGHGQSYNDENENDNVMTTPVRRRRTKRYVDEDTTPTSARELRGWYSYSMAAEVFAVVGVGSFLPVLLEQLARENGVSFADRTSPCLGASSSAAAAAAAAATPTTSNSTRAGPVKSAKDQCLVPFLGTETTTASFAMYTFSAAVLVQALVLISFSSFADYGATRKRLLLVFAFTGAATSVSFLLVGASAYWIAPFLVIVGVTCLGCSFVLLNSFLPLLAGNHPSVLQAASLEGDGRDDGVAVAVTDADNEGNENENGHHAGNERLKAGFGTGPTPELLLSTRISSKGVGLGYAAALFCQLLSIAILYFTDKITTSKTLPLRCVLLLSGSWWAAFTIPAMLHLRTRPGPPLPSENAHQSSLIMRYTAYVALAWTSLFRTVRLAFQLRQMALFLVAWFILSDAIATVSGTAILFARTELDMTTIPIALLSITVTLSGIIGAALWPWVSRRWGWRSNQTIFACLVLLELIPLYGLLGYLPVVRRVGVGGLQKWFEIYPTGLIFGIVMGGLSSYCRSFYGLLIPPGHEVAFYALYAVTDKGSSAIGPAIVGRIVDTTGRIRDAFLFLAVLVLVPMPMIWYVDAEKGGWDARVMAGRLSTNDEARQDAPIELRDHVSGDVGDEADGRTGEERVGLMAGE